MSSILCRFVQYLILTFVGVFRIKSRYMNYFMRWLQRTLTRCSRGPQSTGFRIKRPPPSARRGVPKPAWVREEVLRLAALTDAGCRSIENLFNRLRGAKRKMSVGKSYVSYTMRKHRYEIAVAASEHKRPAAPARAAQGHLGNRSDGQG